MHGFGGLRILGVLSVCFSLSLTASASDTSSITDEEWKEYQEYKKFRSWQEKKKQSGKSTQVPNLEEAPEIETDFIRASRYSAPARESRYETRTKLQGPYLGGMFGMTSPSLDGANSTFGFGFSAGGRFTPWFAAGLFVSNSSQTESATFLGKDVEAKLSFTPIGGEFQFYPLANYVFIGGRVAAIVETLSVEADSVSFSESETEFGLGPRFGIDVPVGKDGFSLGLETGILFVMGDPTNYNIIHAMPSLRYIF